MRHLFIYSLLALLGGGGGQAAATTRVWEVTVTNPLDVPRKDVPVVVGLAPYVQPGERLTSARVEGDTGELPVQLDDLDGDLCPDELVFVADVPAQGRARFRMTLSDTEPPRTYTPRVHAHIKLFDSKLQYPQVQTVTYPGSVPPLDTYNSIYGHGALFESEWVGFRVYMDHRQSIDIYGKQQPRLELDRTNFYTPAADREAGWGCDVLWAGQSVGAGSFRGYVDGQPVYVDSVAWRGQAVRAAGPVRTVVEVTDRDWWYGGRNVQMVQRYILYAGHRDVAVEIRLTGAGPGALFCTGVQKLETANEGRMRPDGLVGSWGTNVPEKAEPDHSEGVGLGVCVPDCNRVEVKEDDYNYLCVLRPDADGRITYGLAICARMEQGGFTNSSEWFRYLDQWREGLEHPCTVHVAELMDDGTAFP